MSLKSLSVAPSTATGTVTSVATGTGLTGGPITTTGTISIATTAVTGGSYGDAADVATFTVNAQGQLTAASNVAISIPASAINTTVPVATGGTGTSTAFTTGSVVFAGASGVYSQNNGKLFWDNTNFRLGIGTASPAYGVDETTGQGYAGYGFLQMKRSSNATSGFVYTYLYSADVAIAILIGGYSDKSTYHRADAHYFQNRGGSTEYARFNSSGNFLVGGTTAYATVTVNGSIATSAPGTVNAGTYSVATTDTSLIFTTTNCTVTLPSASTSNGRILYLKNVTNNSVTSASSNVVPLASTTAGTAILAATAGKFAMLQSDGTNWITMMSN